MRVRHTINYLAADMADIPPRARAGMAGAVRESARDGRDLARDFARATARKHGRHYPAAITSEMGGAFSGFGATNFTAEYGPDISKKQGEMSFERGSRNQKPHLDLARSADYAGGFLATRTQRLVDELFW